MVYTGEKENSVKENCEKKFFPIMFFIGIVDEESLVLPSFLGFPRCSHGKESASNAGDLGSIPGSGTAREGNGNPLWYSCL